jgi:hypothetical protein
MSNPSRFDPASLHAIPPIPWHLQWSADNWSLKWHQTASQVRYLLFPVEKRTRATRQWQKSAELLQQEIELEAGVFRISFKVTWQPGSTELQPDFLVEQTSTAPSFQLLLQWGDYTARQTVTSKGKVTLPPVPLALIGDGTFEGITAPINLSAQTSA